MGAPLNEVILQQRFNSTLDSAINDSKNKSSTADPNRRSRSNVVMRHAASENTGKEALVSPGSIQQATMQGFLDDCVDVITPAERRPGPADSKYRTLKPPSTASSVGGRAKHYSNIVSRNQKFKQSQS